MDGLIEATPFGDNCWAWEQSADIDTNSAEGKAICDTMCEQAGAAWCSIQGSTGPDASGTCTAWTGTCDFQHDAMATEWYSAVWALCNTTDSAPPPEDTPTSSTEYLEAPKGTQSAHWSCEMCAGA